MLLERLKEAKIRANLISDPAGRRGQLERVRILRGMYHDACAEVNRLEGKPQNTVTRYVNNETIFQTSAVWSDINGMTWNRLDGAAWADIMEAHSSDGITEKESGLLARLLNDGLCNCTALQKTYIQQYYAEGKSMPEIAEERGIDKSSVSRAIKRGLSRVGHHVIARLTIARCITPDGKFDYLKFVNSTSILSERQTELLYLALTQDTSYRVIASYVHRKACTISHAIDRAEKRLSSVRVDFIPNINVTGVTFEEWSGLSEAKLAERLGLSIRFFYSTIHRGETIFGVPMLHYHILCRMESGWTEAQTAKELDVSCKLCRTISNQYAGRQIPIDIGLLPPYAPKPIKRGDGTGCVLSSLRDLTSGGNAIIDRLDAKTVSALREAGTC